MAWITKLEIGDYQVSEGIVGGPTLGKILVRNKKTGETIFLPSELKNKAARGATFVTPTQLLEYLIESAQIPHPYDEYV